jgi:hypothetical protein
MSSVSDAASPVRANPADLPARDVPWLRDLVPAVLALVRLGYSPGRIDRAYAYLALFRTAEACPSILPTDRRVIEAVLPRDPAWDQARWDEPACTITA